MATQGGELFEEKRQFLFGIAYRMLGSVADAEDIVQEAFLRYHRALASSPAVGSPRAYLSAVVTRLAIDQLRSARARREAYIGPWLPEPVLTDPVAPGPAAPGPADRSTAADDAGPHPRRGGRRSPAPARLVRPKRTPERQCHRWRWCGVKRSSESTARAPGHRARRRRVGKRDSA